MKNHQNHHLPSVHRYHKRQAPYPYYPQYSQPNYYYPPPNSYHRYPMAPVQTQAVSGSSQMQPMPYQMRPSYSSYNDQSAARSYGGGGCECGCGCGGTDPLALLLGGLILFMVLMNLGLIPMPPMRKKRSIESQVGNGKSVLLDKLHTNVVSGIETFQEKLALSEDYILP